MNSEDVAETFQNIAGRLDYPMFVVTTAGGGERAGCLVGFAQQCSIDPARFMVFLSNKNHTYRVAQNARFLAVHVVPDDRRDIAELFGTRTGDDTDKLAACTWTPGPGDVPVLDACPDAFVGEILQRSDVGDHGAFLVRPVAGRAGGSSFLGFQQVKDLDPGHDA